MFRHAHGSRRGPDIPDDFDAYFERWMDFGYYFKVVRAMYWNAAPEGAATIVPGFGARVLLVAFAAAIIFLGLNQGIIFGFLR